MDNDLLVRSARNPILTAADLPYRAHAVFNPGAIRIDGEVLLLLRVEDFAGRSHFATARSVDGETDWRISPGPVLLADPETYIEDAWGIEDPRIVYLPELALYGVTFTSYSHFGPVVSLALTADFVTFDRRGLIMAPDDKDAALFPRRFTRKEGTKEENPKEKLEGEELEGDWLLIHRPSYIDDPAHIKLSRSPDLKTWSNSELLLPARVGAWWDANKIGLGPPPLETRAGWLLMYHGVRQTAGGVLYRVGLALTERDEPQKVIGRTNDWIFGPAADYERIGDVPNVVFPSGWVLSADGEKVLVYYGAADTVVCLASVDLEELLAVLGV